MNDIYYIHSEQDLRLPFWDRKGSRAEGARESIECSLVDLKHLDILPYPASSHARGQCKLQQQFPTPSRQLLCPHLQESSQPPSSFSSLLFITSHPRTLPHPILSFPTTIDRRSASIYHHEQTTTTNRPHTLRPLRLLPVPVPRPD